MNYMRRSKGRAQRVDWVSSSQNWLLQPLYQLLSMPISAREDGRLWATPIHSVSPICSLLLFLSCLLNLHLIDPCPSFFSSCCDTISDKSKWRGNGVPFSSQFRTITCILPGKSEQQEPETAGQIAPTIRNIEQWMNVGQHSVSCLHLECLESPSGNNATPSG